jgi:hypothetical protein
MTNKVFSKFSRTASMLCVRPNRRYLATLVRPKLAACRHSMAPAGCRKSVRQLTFVAAKCGSIEPYPSDKRRTFCGATLPQTPAVSKPWFARDLGVGRKMPREGAPGCPTRRLVLFSELSPRQLGSPQSLTCRSTFQPPKQVEPCSKNPNSREAAPASKPRSNRMLPSSPLLW